MSLLLAVICMLVNYYYFRIAEIVKLEFASSAEQMHKYILSVGCSPACCYHVLLMNTITDYGFIIGYSLLTLFSLELFLEVFQLPVKPWVYLLAFSTGLFDTLENLFLVKTAVTQHEAFSSFFFWTVRIKWAIAIVPILLIPMIILYGFLLLFRRRQES